MSSTNKTANLELNQWVGTDPVLMSDFNADNQKIDAAIAGLPRIATGSYTGNGQFGSSHKNSITLPFEPKLVFILGAENNVSYISGCIFVRPSAYAVGYGNGMVAYGPGVQTVTWSGKTLSWYCSDGGITYSGYNSAASARLQLNTASAVYYYVALG